MVGQPLRTSPVSRLCCGPCRSGSSSSCGTGWTPGPGGYRSEQNPPYHPSGARQHHRRDDLEPLPVCVHALPVALEEWQTADPAGYRGGGLGYVFTTEDSFTGVDLDHSVDPATGAILPWAQTILETLVSYTQYSVSGTGAHCIVSGRLPSGKRQVGDLQMWDQARFSP